MKTTKFLLVLFATAIFAACDSGDDGSGKKPGDFGTIQVPDVSQLTQTTYADQTQPAKGVSFSTTGAWTSGITDVTRAEAPDWLSISPDHGTAAGSYTIKITLGTNDTGKDRTAKIVITCDGNTITITIVQKAIKEEEGGDEPSDRNPQGLLRKITAYENNALDYTAALEWDADNRITSCIVSDDMRVFEQSLFSYTNNSEMTYTATFYDKDAPYTNIWTCSGIFSQYHCQIASSTFTSDNYNSDYTYSYKDNRLEYISVIGEDGRDVYSYNDLECCSQITWRNPDGTSDSGQAFTYDSSNPLTNRTSDVGRQLFQATNGLNPALLFIHESDLMQAFGFYGRADTYMPIKVITTFNQGANETRQEFSYKSTIPADWKIGQSADCMEITVKEYEGSVLRTTKRFVLTFDGI